MRIVDLWRWTAVVEDRLGEGEIVNDQAALAREQTRGLSQLALRLADSQSEGEAGEIA